MAPSHEDTPTRKAIIRHVLIFQAKLWLEGFKDVILMPLSLVAAIIDLVFRGGALYSVMSLGKKFERWVHLYAALDRGSSADRPAERPDSLDALLNDAADGLEQRTSSSRDGR